MMRESIEAFASQFSFIPEIIRDDGEGKPERVVVGGMGGSHLATSVLKTLRPGIDVYVRRDYGLPPYDDAFMQDALLVASSYSGNTEETLDFARSGLERGYRVAVVTTGGELLRFAEENNLPTIVLPKGGIQPRMALGYFSLAIAKFLGDDSLIRELASEGASIDAASFEDAGEEIARKLHGKVPLVYSSLDNLAVAHLWKIKFNETAKIPAFYNSFPELNHNEMTSFDAIDTTRGIIRTFAAIFVRDAEDDPRIQARMDVCAQLYRERGVDVIEYDVTGDTAVERIFGTLLVADWSALHLSERYGTESNEVPMVEDFKARLRALFAQD